MHEEIGLTQVHQENELTSHVHDSTENEWLFASQDDFDQMDPWVESDLNTSGEDPLTLFGQECPDFQINNEVTNNYFRQEFEMFHQHGIKFGGYRGACWRSRNRVDLYNDKCLSSEEDAAFMFYLTSLIEKGTEETNDQIFSVMKQIQK